MMRNCAGAVRHGGGDAKSSAEKSTREKLTPEQCRSLRGCGKLLRWGMLSEPKGAGGCECGGSGGCETAAWNGMFCV